MFLIDIKISPNRMPLNDISIASFIINYSKQVNQTKILAKKYDTLLKTLTTIKKPCLL